MRDKQSKSRVIGGGLLVAAALVVAVFGALPARAGARNPCIEPGNLTQNCGFDTFADHMEGDTRLQVPTGWAYYILAGSMDFRTSNDTYWGEPSLWLLSDGVPFRGGIYQQVPVTPGVVYQTDAGWAAVTQPDFERKLGLDPTGGSDPLASTVVWGPSAWGPDSSWPDLTVSTRATGPTMTVFVWVDHPTTYGNDWIFIDAVGLWPDANQPPATVTPKPSLTPTRRPPTRTPSPVPPTDTPTMLPASPTPTETATPTPTPIPTQTPTPTATPTWTTTPSPAPPTLTPLPSRTPLPTIVAEVRVAPPAGAGPEPATGRTGGSVLLLVAAGVLLGAILLAGIVLLWWLRGRKLVDEADHQHIEE